SAPPYKHPSSAIDPIWSDIDTWTAIKRAGSPITSFYLLNTLDLESKPDGTIGAVDPGRAVYRDILKRTIGISLTVTLLTLILGFPLAYVLVTTPALIANSLTL